MWVWPLATSRNDGPPGWVGAGRSLHAATKAAMATKANKRFIRGSLRGVRDRSYSAHVHGLPQCRQRVAGGDEFVGDVTREGQVGDCAGDAAPVQLLAVVQLVAAGNAARVEVPDPLRVVANGADHVAFYDLHVIDVVQQLHARRVYTPHHGAAERGVIALIARVIDL